MTQYADGMALSPTGGAFGFRNKIIGGDFTTNPWQRGTSFTAPATSSYTADRFSVVLLNDGVCDVLKTADAPTVSEAGVFTQHCLHVDVTTADATIAAGQFYYVRQRIEGLNSASFGFGQTGTRYVTLSFWHKHTKTGTYCVSLINSASNRSYVAEYTQDVTDTWEKATITILVDTSGTWLYDSGVGLAVNFSLAMGSTYQTTAGSWQAGAYFATANQVNALDNTANNFKLALIQLEAGSVATPFETRPCGIELALCQRYYETGTAADGFFSGDITNTGVYYHTIWFRTTKRAAVTAGTTSFTNVYNSSFPASASTFYTGGVAGMTVTRTANATAAGYFGDNWTAASEL